MASESETVRAEFERWLLEESIGDATARHPKGLYVLPEVEDQWFVWRAAWQAASSSTPSAEAKDGACEWRYHDNDGAWLTGCGQAWSYVDGGPAENHHHFCHCCGKAIAIAQQPKEDGNGPAR